MKDDREMYFPGPQGMAPMGPMGQMGQMNPMGMGPMMGTQGFPSGGMMPNTSQLETRVASLERQVKRLDARISRLETPYPAPSQYAAPDTTTTVTTYQQPGAGPTGQQYTYPYQTSMQVM